MNADRRRPGGFECTACGAPSPRWVGRCSGCAAWGTVEALPAGFGGRSGRSAGSSGHGRDPADHRGGPAGPAVPVTEVPSDPVTAHASGLGELDRVLGGGLVPGAVVLLAGEPGVGKSTLLLEVSAASARAGGRVLYATGEESVAAVRSRAARIGADVGGLWLVEATTLSVVVEAAEACEPGLIVVDSVQTLTVEGSDGAPGSVGQVKAVAEAVGGFARRTGATALLVGHVTKDGAVAGPRTLEHLVDVVCMLEGDRHARLRMLRAVKNRHGPTDEVGCFELDEDGMTEVPDPSGLFLSARGTTGPGACVTVGLEGRRPIAVEIQTLVVPASGAPRRVTSGLDAARVAMVLAVIDRRAGVVLPGMDVYAATVGGLRLVEPAVDLAVAVALAGSVHDEGAPGGLVVIGELGLGGEVRPVPGVPRRLGEAARLGFRTAIVARGCDVRTVPGAEDLVLTEVSTVREALDAVRGAARSAPRLAAVPQPGG